MQQQQRDTALLFMMIIDTIHALGIPSRGGSSDISIKCNVCGDSESNPRLKRGGFYFHNGAILYKCFNDGCNAFDKAWSGERWLKTFSPTAFRRYKGELFSKTSASDAPSFVKQKAKPEIATISESMFYNKRTKRRKEVSIDPKEFISIVDDHELAKKARSLCVRRHIPKDYARKFLVAIKGKYYGRMIIPFFDEDHRIIYFQGRDLIGYTPKYLNLRSDEEKPLYNLGSIDKTKPVMIVEGPIDSMFLLNSVATLGLKGSKTQEELLASLDSYYIFDCDSAGRKEARDYLKDGIKVFNWDTFLKDLKIKYRPEDKLDINDIMLKLNRKDRFSFEELSKYFTNNYYDRIHFL